MQLITALLAVVWLLVGAGIVWSQQLDTTPVGGMIHPAAHAPDDRRAAAPDPCHSLAPDTEAADCANRCCLSPLERAPLARHAPPQTPTWKQIGAAILSATPQLERPRFTQPPPGGWPPTIQRHPPVELPYESYRILLI